MEERNGLLEIRQGSETGAVLYRYAYDDNGSRIEKRDGANNLIQGYAWDQKRRIESVQQGSGAVDMVYDTSDYRVGKATGSSPEDATVYYREAEHLEAAYDENDTLKEKYLRGVVVDELINGYSYDVNGQGTSATYHHDHLRSVVAETGHDGSVLNTIQYDPFGNVLNETGTPQSDLRYTGRMYDPETNLYYYRARYYDAEVGRFISEDPLGFEAGVNFYAYVENSPLNLNDPSGKCPNCATGIAGGIIGGVAGAAGEIFGNPNWTWGSLGRATGVGAATGAAVGFFGPAAIAGTTTALSSTFGLSTATSATISTVGFGAVTGASADGMNQLIDMRLNGSEWNFSRTAIAATSGGIGTAFTVGEIFAAVPAGVTFSQAGTSSLLAYSTNSVTLGALDAGLVVATDIALTGLVDTISEIPTSSASPVPTGSASGGFVIYPSRINMNGSRGVYGK